MRAIVLKSRLNDTHDDRERPLEKVDVTENTRRTKFLRENFTHKLRHIRSYPPLFGLTEVSSCVHFYNVLEAV